MSIVCGEKFESGVCWTSTTRVATLDSYAARASSTVKRLLIKLRMFVSSDARNSFPDETLRSSRGSRFSSRNVRVRVRSTEDFRSFIDVVFFDKGDVRGNFFMIKPLKTIRALKRFSFGE